MKAYFKSIVLFCILSFLSIGCKAVTTKYNSVTIKETSSEVVIENKLIKVSVSLKKGTYSAIRKKDGLECISDATWSVDNWKSTDGYSFTWKEHILSDRLGKGKELVLTGVKTNAPSLILSLAIYNKQEFIALHNGIVNTQENILQVKTFSPLSGLAYRGSEFNNFMLLDGESGEYNTKVLTGTNANELSCFNNILATFGEKGAVKSNLIIGGLSYNEFMKHAKVKKLENTLEVNLWSSDPIGKRVDAGSTYVFNKDRFYIDFINSSRFKILETYANALKVENNVKLDTMTSPGLNFWYCHISVWGGDEFKNTSTGTLDALQKAKNTGFLNYGPLAIRLEPDDYASPNNQQGWWDDQHFQIYKSGKLEKPYETIEKWGNAISDHGGIPLIYVQTARRSLDYAEKFPEHMLFNDIHKERSKGQLNYAKGDSLWSYDFTDPGFMEHMQDVYKNFKNGGLRGVKFDYPDTGWAYDGGMEDPYATTTSAYRAIYELAYNGLGWNSDIHERLPLHGDVCLGAITTHRTEGDTDRFYPVMARKCGLRWYKNRVVTKYVNDVINPFHAFPANNDGWRTMYTMSYLTNARIELGKYIHKMTPEMRNDLTRIVPLYQGQKSARPVDAFSGKEYPQIFDLEISTSWHQVAFFNTALEKDISKVKSAWNSIEREEPRKRGNKKGKQPRPSTKWPEIRQGFKKPGNTLPIGATISVSLFDAVDDGGLGLNSESEYYAYDFWNDHFIGKINNKTLLQQDLRPGETRMMSLHKVVSNPQFISTDRHIMQGLVDFEKIPEWNRSKKTLSGISKVIKDETYTVVLALNGYRIKECSAEGAEITYSNIDENMCKIKILATDNKSVVWNVHFKK
tara:strand:+ start:276 stop:2843 length:2568 start_codon:yes stop_codon:yes gene_type:complete